MDGRLRPLVAEGGKRPGIYAGFATGYNRFLSPFVSRCQARLRASFRPAVVLDGNPVNGVDSVKEPEKGSSRFG